MIVVDTNVILAGLASSLGKSFFLLEKILEGQIQYLMSLKLLREYSEVLFRSINLKKIPLSLSEIESVLAMLVQNATYQETYFRWRPNLKDENDNFLFELAIAGQAESILTFNKKDFENMELKFDMLIETPGEFLRRKKII